MVHDDASSSVTSSSPLHYFSLMSISPLGSPWARELRSDERGLCLIHLLINCANHVAAGSLEHANACLEHISMLASADGDTMQRIAAQFTDALARRALRPWQGLYRALNQAGTGSVARGQDALAARRHFFDLCPFLKLSYLISNQAIMEAMEGEKMVHIVDLCAADPAQWLALLQGLSARQEGPPHLRITGVHEQKELLDLTAMRLSEEAEKLDIPFQFHPVVAKLDALDIESLRVRTGEALAISSVLQLHCLLASDDDIAATAARKPPPSSLAQFHRIAQGTLGELLEKDLINGFSPSPDSASSSPFALTPSAKMERFLASLWGLYPKIMVVTEQESNHNSGSVNERFVEALNFYAALFDCLESTVPGYSPERMRVEKLLFGEEIRNIIACEGSERRERHEKLERWTMRLEAGGFGRVPLSYYGLLQARRLLQSFCCEGYKVRDENGCFHICWQDRALFSVSAWRCRRFD